MKEESMAGQVALRRRKDLWAYAYIVKTPHPEHRMEGLRAFLAEQNAEAREGRTWVARLVTETVVTHVLIVSDSPQLDQGINERVAEKLEGLKVPFSMTAPMSLKRTETEETP